jgi:hypothetical protein
MCTVIHAGHDDKFARNATGLERFSVRDVLVVKQIKLADADPGRGQVPEICGDRAPRTSVRPPSRAADPNKMSMQNDSPLASTSIDPCRRVPHATRSGRASDRQAPEPEPGCPRRGFVEQRRPRGHHRRSSRRQRSDRGQYPARRRSCASMTAPPCSRRAPWIHNTAERGVVRSTGVVKKVRAPWSPMLRVARRLGRWQTPKRQCQRRIRLREERQERPA